MANPNPPSDPPPSISAAELRRRLLASTPPPNAAVAATTDPVDESGTTWNNPAQELLARLRMPGRGSGSIPVQQMSRPAFTATEPQVPTSPIVAPRSAMNRRTPAPNGRSSGIEPGSAIAGALNQLNGIQEMSRISTDDSPMAEMQRLRSENRELRSLLEEMKHLLQEASDVEQQFDEKAKEYETKLEAKNDQIAELSAQLGAIEEQIAKGELAPPPPIPKTRSELEEWSDELEKDSARLTQERKKYEGDRRQLQEDEEALEKQMRDMEVSMARERALIARQETELKRLSAEIQHELDLMQRGDTGLREQMAKFQRRAQDVMTGKHLPPSGMTGRFQAQK
jgi:predicted  nucleic acid-binding Zn-ribbon protein